VEVVFLDCGAGVPQLKRNPLGGWSVTTVDARQWTLKLLLLTLLTPAPVAGQTIPPLTKADFVLGGLTRGMDSALVRQRLGNPDSISIDPHPFDVGAQLVAWHYPGLTVEFFATDHIVGTSTRASSTATRRGLHVGDSIPRLKQLYGEPTDSVANDYDYEDSDDSHLVMRITTRRGRIVEIYLGAIID
jgi:hypothetical protein